MNFKMSNLTLYPKKHIMTNSLPKMITLLGANYRCL